MPAPAIATGAGGAISALKTLLGYAIPAATYPLMEKAAEMALKRGGAQMSLPGMDVQSTFDQPQAQEKKQVQKQGVPEGLKPAPVGGSGDKVSPLKRWGKVALWTGIPTAGYVLGSKYLGGGGDTTPVGTGMPKQAGAPIIQNPMIDNYFKAINTVLHKYGDKMTLRDLDAFLDLTSRFIVPMLPYMSYKGSDYAKMQGNLLSAASKTLGGGVPMLPTMSVGRSGGVASDFYDMPLDQLLD